MVNIKPHRYSLTILWSSTVDPKYSGSSTVKCFNAPHCTIVSKEDGNSPYVSKLLSMANFCAFVLEPLIGHSKSLILLM